LVSPAGDCVPASLSAVLTVDPASPLPVDTVMAVLERIALADRSATTWIDRDGSWGTGLLRGRHTVPVARHIGAAARAAARAARVAEIDIELDRLAAAQRLRQRDRERIKERQQALRDRQRSAPRSMKLAEARTRVTEAVRRASQAV